jgi:hypothetical protein
VNLGSVVGGTVPHSSLVSGAWEKNPRRPYREPPSFGDPFKNSTRRLFSFVTPVAKKTRRGGEQKRYVLELGSEQPGQPSLRGTAWCPFIVSNMDLGLHHLDIKGNLVQSLLVVAWATHHGEERYRSSDQSERGYKKHHRNSGDYSPE